MKYFYQHLLLICIITFFSLIFSSCSRDHRYWYVEQTLINGKKIIIEYDENMKHVWISIPHNAVGGGDVRRDLNYSYDGKEYRFSTSTIPVLLNIWENNFYLVVKGRVGESGNRKSIFRFYKFEKNEFVEIESIKFPKQISIPNIYFVYNYPAVEKPDKVDPKSVTFGKSITAGLWLRLFKNIKYHEPWKEEYQRYLIEYKKKYIDPYWDESALKNNYPVVCNSPKSRNQKK